MTKRIEVNEGIESSFVLSWEGWDEMDLSDLYFYDVILKPGVFPEAVYQRVEEVRVAGGKIDLGLWCQTGVVELYDGSEEPIFKSLFKLTLVEEENV